MKKNDSIQIRNVDNRQSDANIDYTHISINLTQTQFLYSCPSFYSYPIPLPHSNSDSAAAAAAVIRSFDRQNSFLSIGNENNSLFEQQQQQQQQENRTFQNDGSHINESQINESHDKESHNIEAGNCKSYESNDDRDSIYHAHSGISSGSRSEVSSEYFVATAYNEAMTKIFGNIPAMKVAISLTKNYERKLLILRDKQRGKDREKKKRGDNEMERERDRDKGRKDEKEKRKSSDMVENRKDKKEEREIGEKVEKKEDEEEDDEKLRFQLKSLPLYSYSKAVCRIIKSLKISAEKEEEMSFIFRVNSLVDENGFLLSTGKSVLSLEGVSAWWKCVCWVICVCNRWK